MTKKCSSCCGLRLTFLRNSRAFLHPLAHLSSGFRLSHRRFCAALAWSPSSSYQRIFRDVANDLFQRLAAILFWVFQLTRQFRRSLSLEHHPHVCWRQMPLRVARWHVFAWNIVELMTVCALHREEPFAVGTALDVLHVNVAVVALERLIALGMAVHATRVHEDRIYCEKCSA